MTRAFLFVTFRSFRNRIAVRLRRLREPRYLISALAGALYFYFMFLRKMHEQQIYIRGVAVGFQAGELGRDLASVAILAVMLIAWALPSQSGGLNFTESEIQFLFPAPLSRRQLLLYKLFRGVPQTLVTVAVMLLFRFRQSWGIGLLAAFTVQNVYMLFVAQARARLKLAGIGFLIRAATVLALLTALGWALISRIGKAASLTALRTLAGQNAQAVVDAADAPFKDGVVRAILFVPHIFASAAFPGSPLQLFVNCLALAVLGYGAFLLVTRLDVSFEDASIAVSARRAQRLLDRNAHRRGDEVRFKRMPPPFRLRSAGFPELAIVWKNLVAAMRSSAPLLLILLLPIVSMVVQSLIFHDAIINQAAAKVILLFAAFFPLIGTVIFQQDLRLDLRRLELLKAYPLRGDRLVAAELAAPLLLTATGEVLLLGSFAVLVHLIPTRVNHSFAFFMEPRFLTLALLFTIPVCASQLLIRNAAAIVFPAWTMQSKEEPQGIVMSGQHMLILLGNVIVLSLILLPAAAVLGLGFWISHRYFDGGPVAIAAATAPALALLVGEVYFGVKLLGTQFDHLDVSNDFDSLAA